MYQPLNSFPFWASRCRREGHARAHTDPLYIDGAVPLPEKALIRRIRDRAARRSGSGLRGVIGIGDDCAVVPIPRGHEALLTTDFSLENVHFKRAWHPPESVGHRCLTRGLSDIAAMGGDPLAVFLSLAVPREPAAELGGWLPARPAKAGGRVQCEPGRGRHRPISPRHHGRYRGAGLGAEGQGGASFRRPSGGQNLRDW